MNRQRPFFALVLFVLVGLLDRISKFYVLKHLHGQFQITEFLSLCPLFNRGISWGALQFNDHNRFLLLSIVIALVVIGFVWYTYARWRGGCSIIGESLVVAGALSNVLDRFIYRGVVDFILVQYGHWSFPVFNIADMAIVLGVMIMFLGARLPDE